MDFFIDLCVFLVWTPGHVAGPPPPKLPEVVEADVTTTTITISLSASNDTNGEIIGHQIIVEMLGTARARRETTALPDNIYGYQEAQTNGDRLYIAAMFERRNLPAEFVLGNGKTYGGYKNVPLKPGTRYKVYVRGVTERDGKWLYGEPAALRLPETDETPVVKEGDNMVGIIAGVPGALIHIAGDCHRSISSVSEVHSCSGQTPEVSRACSHIYTPLEKREEEEHEYANQIKPPEYMNTYMPLIKGGNSKMLADNSPEYASVL